MPLSPAQRTKLRALARRAWLRILGRAFTADALTPEERAEVGDLESHDSLAFARAAGRGTTPPGDDEEALARERAALDRAGDLVRGIADRAADAFEDVFDREDLRDAVAQAARTRAVPKTLAAELRRESTDRLRDWDRVSTTELARAHNDARADAIVADSDDEDPEVYKVPAPDACSHCLRLHLGPDGAPRIYRMSVLRAHGDNAGRKKSDWRAVVGPTHPHCGCPIFYIAPGWGFDDDGDPVVGGDRGVRYADAGDLQKALDSEDDLQKAALTGGDVVFQGLKIHVEANAGDLRRWKGGSTLMRYAYGEIIGTRGADGEPVDVFLGPDANASFAYAVDQKKPDGSFDEQKLFLGFARVNDVEAAYKAHYPDEFWGGVLQITMDDVRVKLANPDPDGVIKSLGLDGRGWTGRSSGAWLAGGGSAPDVAKPRATSASTDAMGQDRRRMQARRKMQPTPQVNAVGRSPVLYDEPKAKRLTPEETAREIERNAGQLATRRQTTHDSHQAPVAAIAVVPIPSRKR